MRADVKRAFLARRSGIVDDPEKALEDMDMRLRGISLLDETNLMESRLESGDTVTIHFREPSKVSSLSLFYTYIRSLMHLRHFHDCIAGGSGRGRESERNAFGRNDTEAAG